MMRFTEYLLIALLCGTRLIGGSQAIPNGQKSFPNGTTTPVPLYNVSSSTVGSQTTTQASLIKTTVGTTIDSQLTTKTTFDLTKSVLTNETTSHPSPTVSTTAGHPNGMDQRIDGTTTAAPPFVQRIPTDYHFDAMSFMAGSLLTICLVIFGTMVWKMYIAHVERRYWTL